MVLLEGVPELLKTTGNPCTVKHYMLKVLLMWNTEEMNTFVSDEGSQHFWTGKKKQRPVEDLFGAKQGVREEPQRIKKALEKPSQESWQG